MDNEIKDLIKALLKDPMDSPFSWALAQKYEMEDFFLLQCKRLSLDPERAKKGALYCRVMSDSTFEKRKQAKLLLERS